MENILTAIPVGGNRQPGNDPGLCYQDMPDLSRNIEEFDGEGHPAKACEWLSMLESMRTLHRWPDNIALETARMRLSKGARDWHRANVYDLRTWEDFRAAFSRRIRAHESVASKWQRIVARAQIKEELTFMQR